jgi:hypothetical protein
LRSAYRARPPARTSTGLPRSARVSSDRGGCPLDPGDGGAPPEPSGVPGRRLPLPSGQSLNPSSNNPSTGVHFTRHQRGFKQFTRPAIPLACGRPDGTSRRLGFPPGFAPRRPGADNARQGGDRPSSTDLELHAQHHISRSSNRVAHSQRATSCRNARSAHLHDHGGPALRSATTAALLCRDCGSRESACSPPNPRRLTSAPGARSRGGAATGVDAGWDESRASEGTSPDCSIRDGAATSPVVA